MYTLRIYQNYCSVMYIYGDNHDFMFPFFKQHLSHIYNTLTFKFKCQGWVGGGGSIKMGKKVYRFKTESWAQDVSCADIIKIC